MDSRKRTPVRLGVLDFCEVPRGKTARDALFDTIELAGRVEALGYSRYWLAEHHTSTVAHACPEVLLAALAGTTEIIRVGTAGVLLRFYSPLKVAKTFRLLQALFPGRVDLGVGAGRVDDETACGLLGESVPASSYRQVYAAKVGELLDHLHGRKWPVAPLEVGVPEVWVLGSGSPESALLAARHGAAYSLSLFLAEGRGKDALTAIQQYRTNFQPCGTLRHPRWNIAVDGVCAETAEEARWLCALQSNLSIVPSVVGTPESCRDQLHALMDRYETDEIIFLDLCPELEQRIRCYQLLAEALELKPCPPGTADGSTAGTAFGWTPGGAAVNAPLAVGAW